MSIRGIFPIDTWDFNSKAILVNLPEEDIDLLTAHKTEHHYLKGEVIFKEGTLPSGIFFIINGKVKKYKVDKSGKEQIIYVANNGEMLGYHAVLAESRHSDSAAALEESTIGFIPKEDFLDLLNLSKVLNRRLLKTLSHEFAVLENNISLLSQRPVKERLALQLVLLREKYKENFQAGEPVEINMSRDDLAGLVGTARENIVRLLTEFKQHGVLETKGRKIIIYNVHQLIETYNYRK